MQIAVFDFCETIANYQTFDPFLEQVLCRKHPSVYKVLQSKFVKRGINFLIKLLWRVGYRKYVYKNWLVGCSRGYKEAELYDIGKIYYEEYVRPCLIQETLNLMAQLQKDGYKIVIVSGGSKYYIKWFAREFSVDSIITAEIEMKDDKSIGKLCRECLGDEKADLLDQYLGKETLIELCVTDSISDMPMLKRAQKQIVVSHNYHQKWVDSNMEEIVWK